MKTFQEFASEYQLTEVKVEIPTTKAKEYKSELEKAGHKVETADDEGLVVNTKNVAGLKKWLKTKGFDQEDIKNLF